MYGITCPGVYYCRSRVGVLLLLLRKGLDNTREVLGPKRSVQKSFLIILEKGAL